MHAVPRHQLVVAGIVVARDGDPWIGSLLAITFQWLRI